jgi:hypothetical protein
MNGKNWQELDYRIASDYTHGSPEYYRELLRNMIGIPSLLPGEKRDLSTKRHHSPNSSKIPNRRNMPGSIFKDER